MRLVDFHVDWPLQYATESVVFDPALYPDVPARQNQATAYLQTCRLAVISCSRTAEDWARQTDHWAALSQIITRVEAEFCGRLLLDPDDFARFQDDRDGLTWGMIGVEGFDDLIRTTADLDRLPSLFLRGVRLFQPVSDHANLLGGSIEAGDDRGLSDLGFAFLETLQSLSNESSRPILDLAGLNPRAMSEALTWLELDPERSRKIKVACSHGISVDRLVDTNLSINRENLTRLRAMGGLIGLSIAPPCVHSPGQLEEMIGLIASIPFQTRLGHEGIAIGTSFLDLEQTLPGLSNADEVVGWFQARFERPVAKDLLHDNALNFLAGTVGSRHQA